MAFKLFNYLFNQFEAQTENDNEMSDADIVFIRDENGEFKMLEVPDDE